MWLVKDQSKPRGMMTWAMAAVFLMLAVVTSLGSAAEDGQEAFLSAISNMADDQTIYVSHHREERATDEEPAKEPGRTDTSKKSITFEEKVNFLRWHNAYRSNIEPTAANMEQMTWHNDLARLAQGWTDNCVWKHGHPDGIEKPYGWVGQNMYTITGGYHETWSVNSWYDEINNKDMGKLKFGNGGCKGVCGHFTQLVWAASDRLGCGITFCPMLEGFAKNAYFIVCNYGPGGNVKDYDIFDKGTSCSACPTAKPGCQNNLCAPGTVCGGKTCSSGSLIEDVCECGDPNTGATIPEGFGGGSAGHLVASPYVFLVLTAISALC